MGARSDRIGLTRSQSKRQLQSGTSQNQKQNSRGLTILMVTFSSRCRIDPRRDCVCVLRVGKRARKFAGGVESFFGSWRCKVASQKKRAAIFKSRRVHGPHTGCAPGARAHTIWQQLQARPHLFDSHLQEKFDPAFCTSSHQPHTCQPQPLYPPPIRTLHQVCICDCHHDLSSSRQGRLPLREGRGEHSRMANA